MRGRKGTARLLVSLAIAFGVAIPLLWVSGAIAVSAAILTSLVMVLISHRHFKGVTGDVLGATNELARMVVVVVLVAMV